MDEQSISYNTDNSLNSKETDATNSSISLSFENQFQITPNLQNRIISAIAANLNEFIEENHKLYGNVSKDNLFYLDNLPPISLENFIHHLVRYTNMNISSLILSIISLFGLPV